MKRVFVFQDFKSQKFWSIDVVGTDVTVNYGKLGTDGQTQVKDVYKRQRLCCCNSFMDARRAYFARWKRNSLLL